MNTRIIAEISYCEVMIAESDKPSEIRYWKARKRAALESLEIQIYEGERHERTVHISGSYGLLNV